VLFAKNFEEARKPNSEQFMSLLRDKFDKQYSSYSADTTHSLTAVGVVNRSIRKL